MPAKRALLQGIAAQEAQCKELLKDVGVTLEKSSLEEGELMRIQSRLEYALRNLTAIYKQLQDHYNAQEDVTLETQEAHYIRQRDGVLPLEDRLREVKARIAPKESSSRTGNWVPLKLEAFTGEVGKFQFFMDNFEATVDSRRDLHAVEKLMFSKVI